MLINIKIQGGIMELVDYEEYIVGNGFVTEGKSPYYANWVSKFLYLQLSSRATA
jgi:hypothetical protein